MPESSAYHQLILQISSIDFPTPIVYIETNRRPKLFKQLHSF